jgi:SPX domain protein involved in polyphosphate accumulation
MPACLPACLPACPSVHPQGSAEEEVERVSQLFTEVQRTVDAKQLKPMIRTQYMRTAFQIPFDPTVRIRCGCC